MDRMKTTPMLVQKWWELLFSGRCRQIWYWTPGPPWLCPSPSCPPLRSLDGDWTGKPAGDTERGWGLARDLWHHQLYDVTNDVRKQRRWTHWRDNLWAWTAVCDPWTRRCWMTQPLCGWHHRIQVHIWRNTKTNDHRNGHIFTETACSAGRRLPASLVKLTSLMWPVRGRVWCESPALRLGALTAEQVNHTTTLAW